MFIDRWMDKEVVVHIHNGILLNNKNDIWVSSNEVDEPTDIMQSEVSQKKWKKKRRKSEKVKCSQQKQDQELTGSDHEFPIAKFELKLKNVGKNH